MMEEEGEGFLVVGLGNPGKKYDNTRHNIGFRVVKALAAKYGVVFRPSLIRAKGNIGKGKIGEKIVHLLLPLTFMNESGLAVKKSMHYYKIPPSGVLIVTDDIALPFAELRLRTKGSCGGHNGLKSIEHHLKTTAYPRLRIGVGDREEGDLAEYVLDDFTEEEKAQLPPIIGHAISGIELWLERGAEAAMQEMNK